MKNLSLVLVLLLSAVVARAQSTHFSVENKNVILGNVKKVVSTIDIYATHSFTSKIGMFTWALVSRKWSESYIGISYSPWSWCHLSAGVGLETNKNPLRVGGIIFLTHKKSYGLLILEDGGSGKWWEGILNYNINKKVGFGIMTQKYLGTGLRSEYNIPKTPIQIWAAILYSKDEAINAIVSLKSKF